MTRALILGGDGSERFKVAGLSVLDRLVVALHRAGCESITIASDDASPPLRRARALGIEVETIAGLEEMSGLPGAPLLVAAPNLLVTRRDVEAVLERGGRLLGRAGEALPLGFSDDVRAEAPLASLRPGPGVRAGGPAAVIGSREDARRAERALWSSLDAPHDGVVDRYFNRPLARPISRLLVHTPVTPNQVTVVSLLVGLVAAWFFSRGSYREAILGAVLFQLSAVIDCIDGEIARIAFRESAAGKWLDVVLDQVVHACVFGAIAWGLWRPGENALPLLLGASAVSGALLSFAVMASGGWEPGSNAGGRLEKMIEGAATRDFSVLILALALLDRLDLWLWAAAVGVHFYWIAALAVRLAGRRKRRARAVE